MKKKRTPKAGSSPATKLDVQMLMEHMGKLEERVETSETVIIHRLKRHFDVAVENMRYDLLGVNKDRMEDHESRLTRLESRIGA